MSHELRTPLNAVIGFSDIMRQRIFGPLPDRYADYATSIHEAGGHLLDLINDVLDVSKIEAERYELALERFDARDVISAAIIAKCSDSSTFSWTTRSTAAAFKTSSSASFAIASTSCARSGRLAASSTTQRSASWWRSSTKAPGSRATRATSGL
jgi:hypothetical protein